jgi:Protein of unknown function (DUF1360)
MHDDLSGFEGRLLKLGLVAGFVGLTGIGSLERLVRRRARIGPMQLLMLGAAAYRVGHMVAYERVAEPLREPFTAVVADGSGAGDTVVARGRGARWVIGELLSCPVCAGTWATLGLFIGLGALPRFTQSLITVLSATGVAELLDRVIEALTWRAERSRSAAGRAARE